MKAPIKSSSILAGFLATSAVALGVGFAAEVQLPAARYITAEARGFNALATQRLGASAPVCETNSPKIAYAFLDRIEV